MTMAEHPMASLEGLPDDVMAHVLELLPAAALARLRLASRTMDRRVQAQGMPLYLSQHRVRYVSLSLETARGAPLPPAALFNHQARVERNLAQHALHAVQVGDTWARRCLPVLCLDADRLVIGAGGDILVHPLVAPSAPAASTSRSRLRSPEFPPLPLPPSRRPGTVPAPPRLAPRAAGAAHAYPLSARSDSDIVGLHALPGGEVVSAQFDGTLQRLSLGTSLRSTAHYAHPREHVYALSGRGDAFLALAYGAGRLYAARAPWLPAAEFAVAGRPWSGLLAAERAFVGVRGEVAVHALRPDGVQRVLGLRADADADADDDGGTIVLDSLDSLDALDAALGRGRAARRSTPYAVAVRDGCESVVLSAWHDGVARLHDLRSGACELQLSDPWQDAPLYCADFVGEHGAAAGGAQHGIVSLFDLRRAGAGYSLFSPQGRGSPVYALAADGGRVWGVSERRAFVCAWDGSGAHPGGLTAEEPHAYLNGHAGYGGHGAHPGGRGGPRGRGRGRGRGGGGGGKDVPRKAGGKCAWAAGHGEVARDTCMGYRHEHNGTALFETLVPA